VRKIRSMYRGSENVYNSLESNRKSAVAVRTGRRRFNSENRATGSVILHVDKRSGNRFKRKDGSDPRGWDG
jgi:hypothetical protein